MKERKGEKKREERKKGHGHPEAILMQIFISFIGKKKGKKSVFINNTPSTCMLILFRGVFI